MDKPDRKMWTPLCAEWETKFNNESLLIIADHIFLQLNI